MVDLLKRWMEVEPDKCDVYYDIDTGSLLVDLKGCLYGLSIDSENFPLLVECAVRLAIEDRGLFWSVRQVTGTICPYIAEIESLSDRSSKITARESTPGEALLSAYLKTFLWT